MYYYVAMKSPLILLQLDPINQKPVPVTINQISILLTIWSKPNWNNSLSDLLPSFQLQKS